MSAHESIAGADDFAKVMEQVTGKASAKSVFGKPVVVGDKAVIPVAQVSYSGGGGFGAGSGGGECGPTCPPDCTEEHGEGSGMGLGFMVQAKPIGTIEVTATTLEFRPIIDFGGMAKVWTMVGAAVALGVAVRSLFLSR